MDGTITNKGIEMCKKITNKILKYDKCKLIAKCLSLKEIFIFKGLIDKVNKMSDEGIKFFNPDEILKNVLIVLIVQSSVIMVYVV